MRTVRGQSFIKYAENRHFLPSLPVNTQPHILVHTSLRHNKFVQKIVKNENLSITLPFIFIPNFLMSRFSAATPKRNFIQFNSPWKVV